MLRRWGSTRALLGLSCILLAVGAATVPTPESALPRADAAPSGAAAHVVVVSIDGLNPRALARIGPAGVPTMTRLRREGAFTPNARTVVESTLTLPNHASMLTGRRVAARRGGHGLVTNLGRESSLHRQSGGYVASVFDVVKDAGGSTALYANKDKFRIYARTWNQQGRGGAKVDRFHLRLNGGRLVQQFRADVAASPDTFAFLHLAMPDVVGHARGFMSPAYLRAVRRADVLLGRVLRTIEQNPRLRGRTTLLVTSDHGGRNSHLDPTKRYAYTIPFFAWGAGVPARERLYRLNPRFGNPRGARVGYAASRQPVRNAGVANLATRMLGLPAVPGSTVDRAQSLRVSR